MNTPVQSKTVLLRAEIWILEIQNQHDCNSCPPLFLLKVLKRHILTECHLFAQGFSPVLYSYSKTTRSKACNMPYPIQMILENLESFP